MGRMRTRKKCEGSGFYGRNSSDPLACLPGYMGVMRAFEIFITVSSTAIARTVPSNAVEQIDDVYLHSGAGASGSDTALKCGIGILDGPGAGTNGNAVVLLNQSFRIWAQEL